MTYVSISKSVSVRSAAIAALIAAALASGVAGASEYRLPSNCFKTFSQVTNKDGSTVIRVQTTCEYTQAQRDRMAKEGR